MSCLLILEYLKEQAPDLVSEALLYDRGQIALTPLTDGAWLVEIFELAGGGGLQLRAAARVPNHPELRAYIHRLKAGTAHRFADDDADPFLARMAFEGDRHDWAPYLPWTGKVQSR